MLSQGPKYQDAYLGGGGVPQGMCVKACCISCLSPSGDGRVWCEVGIGVGLLRYDRKVEAVVVKNDAIMDIYVRGRA